MGFFNKYPYTNEHELNLDWIIAKINALKDRVKAIEDAIHDIVVVTPNNGKLTIKRNDTIVGDFTADQATDEDINIVVPENTSDLNNDSDFITSSDLPDMNNYYDKTETDNLLNDKADISSLATVATTGDYDDLINTPSIPAAQVNSDWNAISGVSQILNKPTIPTVNDATLTIQQNGTSVSTFTANASSNVTANITCENKITWTNSGNWHYWTDSNNVKHLHYNASISKEYSGSIGALKYVSSPEVISLPISISNIYSMQATVQFTSDICGAAIHSYSSNSISVWLWSCVTGTKSIRLHIDITGL